MCLFLLTTHSSTSSFLSANLMSALLTAPDSTASSAKPLAHSSSVVMTSSPGQDFVMELGGKKFDAMGRLIPDPVIPDQAGVPGPPSTVPRGAPLMAIPQVRISKPQSLATRASPASPTSTLTRSVPPPRVTTVEAVTAKCVRADFIVGWIFRIVRLVHTQASNQLCKLCFD